MGLFRPLFPSLQEENDEGNILLWKAAQQDAHFVPSLWIQGLSPAEVQLREVWLSRETQEKVQLECQGQEEEHHRHRPSETPEGRLSQIQEWLPGGDYP